MRKLIKNIWKDSVGSKLIAAGLLGVISLIYSTIKSNTQTIDFKSALISFWTFNIPLWLIILILIIAFVVIKIIRQKRSFKYEQGELELDKKLFLDIRDNLLPQNRTIGFLRYNNFAGFSFDDKMLEGIENYESKRDDPNFHFFHPNLEKHRIEMLNKISQFTYIIAGETFPTPQGRQTVPPEWETEQPERFDKVVNDLHTLKNEICQTYDDFIKSGRNIFKV